MKTKPPVKFRLGLRRSVPSEHSVVHLVVRVQGDRTALISGPTPLKLIVRYLANLSKGRLILWCYFIWYCVVLVRYFDPSLKLWLTSLGLSLIIGIALYLSTTATDKVQVRLDFWKTFRLFLMPFCVSSFAALVKGKGFILIFSPHPGEVLAAAGGCAVLCSLVFILKRANRPRPAASAAPPEAEHSLRDRA